MFMIEFKKKHILFFRHLSKVEITRCIADMQRDKWKRFQKLKFSEMFSIFLHLVKEVF